MKRINPRLAKLHRSYALRQLADLLGVHKNTVRAWIKEGLPKVDGAKPTLIHGSEFQVWWGKRREATKRPCQPGELYCFKCRAPKRPALGMVEYVATNAVTGNLSAFCETCETSMHQSIRMDRIATRMPGLDVQRTLASPSISVLANPSLNCDKTTGA